MSKVCLANKDCPTGYCLAGTCTEPSSYLDPCSPTHPDSCSSITHVSGVQGDTELVCSEFSHLCVLQNDEGEQEKGKCDTAIHCSVDKYCPAVMDTSGSEKSRKCQARKFEGKECQRQEECMDGLECYLGFCRRRVHMVTMAECKEKEKQVAVTGAKYGVCIPSDAVVVPAKSVKTEGAGEKESNATLWIVGGIIVALTGLVGAAIYVAYLKGYIGKKREGSSGA